MMPPRAVLTINAVRFIRASRAASNRPTVSGVFGQWMVMKSARATAASRSPHRLVTHAADRLGIHVGVVDQHVHLHRAEPFGRAGADLAKADDQHGFAVEIDRHLVVAVVPAAFLDHRIHAGAAPRQVHQQVHPGLGDADRIGGAGDHQRDFARGSAPEHRPRHSRRQCARRLRDWGRHRVRDR